MMSDTSKPSRAQRCELNLPTPPRVDGERGKIFEAWFESAGQQLINQRPIAITGPVALRVRAGLPEQPRGLDHIAKALCDLLATHGMIEDDTAVMDWRLSWDRAVEPGRCSVELWRTSPPHQRITSESRRRVSKALKLRWADIRARA